MTLSFSKLWQRAVNGAMPAERPALDGRVYAIGDVHGRADLLASLLDKIDVDLVEQDAELIFLGDYIDRGPSSREVIELLIELKSSVAGTGDGSIEGLSARFLMGNHEAVMLQFLSDTSVGASWTQWGGDETLMSYGVRPPIGTTDDPAVWEDLRQALAEALPASHLQFLRELELTVERGPYFFVHAGVDPDRPLEDQGPDQFLWIRDDFLESRRRLDRIIVHGHTPEERPYADKRRIGVDTGAYITGKLTAVCLEGDGIRYLQG